MNRFQEQMRRLDKTLFLRLDRKTGRYVVYRRDRKNLPRQILVIETPDGEFSYPNYEHIAKLYQMDSWQNKNLIKEMDEHNSRLEDESNARIARISNETSKLVTRSAYF
jgi:hypothetical protein